MSPERVGGEDTIIAGIVPVDDSLMWRLKVDPPTGCVQHAERSWHTVALNTAATPLI